MCSLSLSYNKLIADFIYENYTLTDTIQHLLQVKIVKCTTIKRFLL